MMSYRRQVSRTLDDEHRANLDLLGRVEQAFSRAPRFGNAGDGDLAQLAAALGRHVEQDIGRHFEFEERELFPAVRALPTDAQTAIRAGMRQRREADFAK